MRAREGLGKLVWLNDGVGAAAETVRGVVLDSDSGVFLALVFRVVRFFIVTDVILVPLRGLSVRGSSCSTGIVVPASSPRSFASATALLRSSGTGA